MFMVMFIKCLDWCLASKNANTITFTINRWPSLGGGLIYNYVSPSILQLIFLIQITQSFQITFSNFYMFKFLNISVFYFCCSLRKDLSVYLRHFSEKTECFYFHTLGRTALGPCAITIANPFYSPVPQSSWFPFKKFPKKRHTGNRECCI